MVSLEDEIQSLGGPLELLRSGRSGAYVFPVKAEFTNWRDEQESWRTTAALMDLSLHMPDLIVEGPDVFALLAHIGANSFRSFGPMKAKQLIAVGYDGNMVGDAILFCLGENLVRIVGRPPALNWVQFHAETGDWNVTVRKDERAILNPKGRELYRLQLQGPTAGEIFEKVNGGPLPEIKFSHMGKIKIGSTRRRRSTTACRASPGWSSSARTQNSRGCATRCSRQAPSSASPRSAVAHTPPWQPSPAGSPTRSPLSTASSR